MPRGRRHVPRAVAPATARCRSQNVAWTPVAGAPRAADLDGSLVVGVVTGVAPERSFCFFNAVYELVLQLIACCFAIGHETPGQRQILVLAGAV